MNHRGGQHLFLVIGLTINNGLTVLVGIVAGAEFALDKQDAHAALHVGARRARHQHAAFAIERYLNVRLTILIETGRCIRYALARNDDFSLKPFSHTLPGFASIVESLALRDGRVGLGNETKLKVGHLA